MLKIRKNSRGQWYPMTDLRERPTGEPIVFEWMKPRKVTWQDIENLATCVLLLVIGVFMVALAVIVLLLFGFWMGLGVILWTLGKCGR